MKSFNDLRRGLHHRTDRAAKGCPVPWL